MTLDIVEVPCFMINVSLLFCCHEQQGRGGGGGGVAALKSIY